MTDVAKPRRKSGPPKGVPKITFTEEQKKAIVAMAGYGIPHDDIAEIYGCSADTLQRRLKTELRGGKAKRNAKVLETLFRMATSGDCPQATIFAAKVWGRLSEPRDVQPVELSGPGGGPIDVRAMTDEQRAERVRELMARAEARLLPEGGE